MTDSAEPIAPLKILFQDESLVAIHKPAGHIVHPTERPQAGDLVTMKILRDQIGVRVYNIHRIDRPTAGVLLFGIDREISKSLHQNLADGGMEKVYWAVVEGKPELPTWTCTASIQKDADASNREAHTDFEVLKTIEHRSGKTISLIKAVPHTGRFHQIRRHLLDAKHPIIGDYRYAGIATSDANGKLLGTGTRMLLLAKSLTFEHPKTGATIHAETNDPLIDQLFGLSAQKSLPKLPSA